MKLFWNLSVFAFFSATLIGCSGDAPKPTPAPKIDLGSSSESTDAPAGNTEPEAGAASGAFDPTAETVKVINTMQVKPGDWPQFGGSHFRNNVPEGKGIATEWDVDTGENIKWAANLGSETYGNPIVANGKVYVGTNNGSGYMKRYPSRVDLGCLLCFDEETGEFLWQHSSEKLPAGRVNDWPNQGICSAPLIVGDRVWYVTSRGEVVCLDADGFRDGENDGPFKAEKPDKADVVWDEQHEADVVWKFDMMSKLGVFQHNMCSCSVTFAGDTLFVNTSNGVDEAHLILPQANAPSFVAMNMHTGEVLWTDNSPGENVLHGQWSSPGFGVLGGQEQVLFAGGDGWLYSFDPKGEDGKSKLLWKFDCNPKDSVYLLGGRATRNHLIATPVVYDGLVYIAVGEDPEHGEGVGHLWCIDPTKRGDVSPTIVVNSADPSKPIAHKRIKALEADLGDIEKENANSAAVWHYMGNNPQLSREDEEKLRRDGKNVPKGEFGQTMHRTCGTVAIKNDLLFIADFSGLFHCLDVKTGKAHWTYDMLSASWASPLIVEGRVYISDEDGDISIFGLSAAPHVAMKEMKKKDGSVFMKDGKPELFPLNGQLSEIGMVEVNNSGGAVFTTPIVANNMLFIANRNQLFCIKPGTKSKVEKPMPVSAESD